MPSTITVTNPNNDGGGSLRAAIVLANTDAEDTITFAPSGTGTITLLLALPDLTTAIILSGPEASALTVARSSDPATPQFRIFKVTAGAEVAISGLTISGGRVFGGNGGGIANAGTLTETSSTFSGNSASGAGIINSDTLKVIDSTLSGNSASGGGISNDFIVTVTIITSLFFWLIAITPSDLSGEVSRGSRTSSATRRVSTGFIPLANHASGTYSSRTAPPAASRTLGKVTKSRLSYQRRGSL